MGRMRRSHVIPLIAEHLEVSFKRYRDIEFGQKPEQSGSLADKVAHDETGAISPAQKRQATSSSSATQNPTTQSQPNTAKTLKSTKSSNGSSLRKGASNARDLQQKGASQFTKDKAKEKVKQKTEDKAQKAFEKMASKAGPWGRAAAIASKLSRAVGVKPWQIVLFLGTFQMFIFVIPFILIIFFWEHPAQALLLGIKTVGNTLGFGMNTVIENGGASKLAYEVPTSSGNSAQAATGTYNPSSMPAAGTYAYKLSKIDWEKSKFQTLSNYSACNVVTQEVVAPDGTKRSVVTRVELKDNPGQDLQGIARANCLDNVYPIFNTIMRSKFVREGVNKAVGVRYAYAAPEGASELSGKSDIEVSNILRNKSLSRIWERSGEGVTGFTAERKASLNPNQLCQKDDRQCFENIFSFFYTEQEVKNEGVRDCANTFDFTDPKTFDKAVNKAKHDLECGVDPETIKFMYTLPNETDLDSTDPSKVFVAKYTSVRAMCEIYTRTQKDEDAAIERYKQVVESRVQSEAVSAFQAQTYASTNRSRFLNIGELKGDSYKVLGMGNAQEYKRDVIQEKQGIALDSDAASRVLGLPNNSKRSGILYNDKAVTAAQEVIDILGSTPICTSVLNDENFSRVLESIKNPLVGNILVAAYGASINPFYDSYFPKYQRAIATLDFYSQDNKGKKLDIKEAAKKVTIEDLFTRLARIESNVSTSGIEQGTQNFNRMSIGMKAYKNALSTTMGGSFLDANRAVAQEQLDNQFALYNDSVRGVAWRLFDGKNPRSVSSRIGVAFVDKPKNIVGNIVGVLGDLFSPAKNLIGSKASLAYSLTGKSNVAQAAESYEINGLRIDPAAIPEGFKDLDPLQAASTVEKLKQNSFPAQILFTQWDLCFKEYIPSRFHLLYPKPEKADLYNNYCRELFDITAPNRLTEGEKSFIGPLANSTSTFTPGASDRRLLSFIYRAYHFYNLQADALTYLSNPTKEDESYNASSSLQSPTSFTPQGPVAPIGGAGDTSSLTCPPGTNDKGIATKYGPGKVPQHQIRLCEVGGITVNVSIVANLKLLLEAASAAGIKLGGSGFRSYDEQVFLRDKNCNGSVCSPPTALPGNSNHENGEAIDFNQTDVSPFSSGSGFTWMKQNAARFGLKNLKSEPWHWSVTGN